MRYSLDDLSRKTSDDHRHLIFLISLPRSGSTLLQRVLNGNKEIHTASESWFMLHPLHAFKTDKIEAKYDHNLAISATQEFISQIPEGMDLYYKAVRYYGLTFYNRALEISGKRYYLDKTPRYYTIIPELLNTFPDARFLLLLRNPMAVLSSVLQTWFNNVPAKLTSTSNYRDLIEGPNALVAGIEHLKQKAAVVYYEDLVINPQSCIERICNYLDISFDKEMLEYGGRKPPIGKFGDNVGINQHERPVRKNINKWISNFSEEKLRAFCTDYLYKLGSETFTRLGYDFSAIESVVGSIFENSENSNLNLDRQFTNSYRLSAQSSLKLQYDELIISLKDSTPDTMVKGINRFLSINPCYADAHNDLGVLYSSIEEHEKALEHYHKAVSLNTHNIVFQKNLADFLFIVMSDIPGALEIYTRLLEYNQKDIETLYAIGQISFQCGKIDDAKSFFNRILVLSPGHMGASQALATIRNAGHGAERSNSELPSSRSNSKNNIEKISSSGALPGNENILIATSLAPHAIELQRKAVKSWLKLGFEVVSLNSPEEITVLKHKFPWITFHAVKRNGKKRFGKPYVYFDDFLRFFKKKDYAVYGIVNSDIHLKANKTISSFLKSEAVGSLIYGSRLDVHNLENFQGDFYLNGFDFFFFDRSILGIYPESIVSIGVTWWDYWAVLIPALNNVTIKKIITPLAYHVKHENRWDPKQWHHVGRHISNYLKDQDSKNTQRRPPASNYSVFYEMLQNCVALKSIDKNNSDRALRCLAYEDLSALNICILDFLDYMSQKTILPWDNFINSRTKRPKGSNFYSSISTADTNANVANFRSEAFQNCSRLYNRAMRLYREDKPDAAEKVLNEITLVLPGYPPASNHLGVMLWEQGFREKALAYFNAAFRFDPYDRSTVINCATAMIHSGKSKEARKLYAAYLRTNPGDLELGRWQRKLESNDIHSLPRQFSLHSKQDLQELPVLVYQMGKVGSTSITKSLEHYGIPAKHAHTLSWSGIEHAEELFSKNSKRSLPVWVRHYRGMRAEIDRLAYSGHWKIITLVRDPLRRYISELFQNFNRNFPAIQNFNNCDVTVIRDHIQQYLQSFDEEKDHACCWFDKELKEVFGIDVFSVPFNTNRGYQQYSTERANVLLLRLENLSSSASEALEPFLSFSPFKLIDSNVSETKPYAKIYKQLLSNLIIDRSLLDRFYSNRLAKHFYSESEIETFKKKWTSPQARTTFSKPQNLYRVSAVVSTFSSEKFIEGRLQNLIDQSLFKKNKLEVIIVDSNSPENERRIVEKYASKHPNILYCRTPERETVYKAWNRGIDMAHGTYFVNANTDDRFASNALEVMADYLDAHSEYDAAYGNWMVTRTPNDTFESDRIKRFFEYPEFHPGLFFYLQITSHANFIRRSVFAKIGNFNGSYTVFGDREFMFRFAAAGHRAIKLNNTVGLYLENPTSIEHANKDIGLKECAVLYDDYLNPACFSNLMGHVDEPSSKTLSKDYTKVGCYGMDLYRVDGKSMHALGSPAKLFAKAIELDPHNVEALNNMGVIAMHRKASKDAVRFFNNARNIALDVQKKVIDHNLSLTRCGISSPDQLRFIFPADFRPITINNSIYQNTGRNRKPIAAKSSKINLKIRSNVPTATQRLTKKQLSKSKLRSKPPKETSFSSPSPVLRNVWQAYLRDNLCDARRSLLHHLEKNPEDWQSYELLVDIMLQSGKETEICAQLRPLESHPNLPAQILSLIGSGYEAIGDFSQADYFVNQALAKDGRCARGWNLKGVLDYRNGHHQAAVLNFQKASECDTGWGDPWTNLGSIWWEQGDNAKAIDCFENGFHLSPASPNVAATYHIAISQTGHYERARSFFEAAVQQHPDFRKVRYLLIDILIQMEQYPDALNQIEAVIVRFGCDSQLLEAAKVFRKKIGPMALQPEKHPSLSLCMIVKNEEKYLPRCLESLKPVVDEMIIVDTGSRDATRNIAEVFGARVFDFEWGNDFSAARNFSLQHATGDWVLVMDADEVIAKQDHDKLFQQLCENNLNKDVAYMMLTRNYTSRKDSADWVKNAGEYPEETSLGWIPSKKVRLFRNHQGVHFAFPVHEQVDPFLHAKGVSLIECPIPVHHYGKLDHDRTLERWQMYYEIGKQKLKALGKDKNALKEMAVQAGLLLKWDEAAFYWKKYLDLNPDSQIAYMNLTRIMAESGDFKQANHFARKAVRLSTDCIEPFYNLALSELQIGKTDKAAETANRMVKDFPGNSDGLVLRAVAVFCTGNIVEGSQLFKTLLKNHSKKAIFSQTLSLIVSIRTAGFDNWVKKLVGELKKIEGFSNIQIMTTPLSKHKFPGNSKLSIANDVMDLNISVHASQTHFKKKSVSRSNSL